MPEGGPAPDDAAQTTQSTPGSLTLPDPGLPANLPLVQAPAELFRVHASDANPLALVHHAAGVSTQTARFVDLSTSPAGAAFNQLQDLRPDPSYAAAEHALGTGEATDGYIRPPFDPNDIVRRVVSSVEVSSDGLFAPVADPAWQSYLKKEMHGEIEAQGTSMMEFLSTMNWSAGMAADLIFQQFPSVAGIILPSPLGVEYQNYYVFEKFNEENHLRTGALTRDTRSLGADMPEIRGIMDSLRQEIAPDAGTRLHPTYGGVSVDTPSISLPISPKTTAVDDGKDVFDRGY